MRKLICVAILAAACGDAGPRDRTLRIAPGEDRPSRRRRAPTTSVIGLVGDQLAPLYPADATVIVRFAELSTLREAAADQFNEVARMLPALGLPTGKPEALLRKMLGLLETRSLDPMRPFALVKTKAGWAGVVPTRSESEQENIKPLDGLYSVAGDAEVVAAYSAAWKKGFYLPGECSVVTRPDALGEFGLDAIARALPADITRIDMSLRFDKKGTRVDLRLAPDGNGDTALLLERMKPALSKAMPYLPADGTMYVELRTPAAQWEKLLLRFAGGLPQADAEVVASVRQALTILDQDTAVMLDLDPNGSARVALVAHLGDESYADAFIGSSAFRGLLKHIAGPGGSLDWKPDAFRRDWVQIGIVTGNISRRRLKEWRNEGLLSSTVAMMLRGPVLAYVAVVDEKLCVLIGQRTRPEVETFLSQLRSGRPGGNDHATQVDPLFKTRLGSVSLDLADLFDGTRSAAPAWHKNGRALTNLALRWRIPAAAAVTVEGGALRVAIRLRPRMIADAASKITEALQD